VSGLLIIIALFALMWVLMIRPQRAKAQQQRQLLGTVAPGDEVLTVGGIYGIVQELEPEEDGGDLIVEIADGIHVRVARKALATVVKPDEDEDEEEEEEEEEEEDDDVVDGEAELIAEGTELPAGVEDVNGEAETVNPGAAEQAAPPGRS
jgi:preprotein translocase subunit YajC